MSTRYRIKHSNKTETALEVTELGIYVDCEDDFYSGIISPVEAIKLAHEILERFSVAPNTKDTIRETDPDTNLTKLTHGTR